MNVLYGGRAWGKTYAIVQWLKDDPDNRVIVEHNERAANDVAKVYDLSRTQVISFDEFQRGGRSESTRYAIDNVDLLFTPNVDLVSITGGAIASPTYLARRESLKRVRHSPEHASEFLGEWKE